MVLSDQVLGASEKLGSFARTPDRTSPAVPAGWSPNRDDLRSRLDRPPSTEKATSESGSANLNSVTRQKYSRTRKSWCGPSTSFKTEHHEWPTKPVPLTTTP